jgi:glycosyltransferase involved in cell wall biosynthesis
MKRRKILFCIDCLVRGGTELQLIGLIDRLDREKYEPYLLTIKETDNSLLPDDCHHLQWSVPKLLSLSGLSQVVKLTQWLRKENISIVQCYFQDSTLLAGVAAWLARVPVRIACFRDMAFWKNSKLEVIIGKVYQMMTGYISNAHAVSEHFVKHFNLQPQKMTILPNGIDVEKLTFIQHKPHISDICIVGNMTRKVKRTDLFIAAAALVAKKYPDIKWHIIGDGHLKETLQLQANELGITEKVVFEGRVANVDKYIEQMQIGVICSDSEGLSNAILEYMLKGSVCIATDVGGNPELIIDEVSGCIVPPDNAEMIASKVLYLIESPSKYTELALKARHMIESQYNWKVCVGEHMSYYSNALAKRNK